MPLIQNNLSVVRLKFMRAAVAWNSIMPHPHDTAVAE
jgi:hypothetical protein